MLLFLLCALNPLQGVVGDGFYLLDSTEQDTTAGYGLLMYNTGTVCDDAFNNKTAGWICRMMGYESLKQWEYGRKYSWQDNYAIELDQVQCTGSVVPQCSYLTNADCGHSEDVWLSCNIRKQRGDLNSFYLLDNSARYTQSGHGLLVYQGGTVCDDGFDDRTANWICRLMGYENAADWTQDNQFSFQNDLPIKVDNLVCSHVGAYSDILPSCDSGISTADDTHDEDIWIWCNSAVIAQCPAGYKVRLDNKLCQKCPPATYSPTPNIDYTCLACPQGSNSSAGAAYCTCEGGSYLIRDLSICLACPTGTVSREGSMSSKKCVPCPEGTIPINDGKGCSCKKGHGWMWTSDEEGTCSPCPANSFKQKIQGTCRQCPVEATSLPLSEGCMCAVGLSWNGENCLDCVTESSEDNVCGCSAGTFRNTDLNVCEECPENHYSENYSAYCTKCAEGTSPSQDKTLCKKSGSTDALSVTSLALSLLVLVLILALVIWFKMVARNNTKLKLCYQPEPSTLQISDRRCMCPDCPCSEAILNRPTLPPRGASVQDVYANFQH